MSRKIIIALFVFFICFHICLVMKYAVISFNGTISEPDISAFYYAGKVVMDHNIPNSEVYNLDLMYEIGPDYGINQNIMPFVYSIASAYIMSPLTLIPYNEAKFIWGFLNLLMYLGSIAIFLNLCRASKVWLIYSLAISLAWFPFIYNQVWLQSNALIIFLVALASYKAMKDRPIIAGILIGIASLFKIFPIALAMVLGIKNWRIFVACAIVYIASFLIPGSLEWFSAIQNIHVYSKSIINIKAPINFLLSQFGIIAFFIYAIIIAGITAVFTYRNRNVDYNELVSFAVPAAFLVSPLVDYHHLTILALSYSYIISKVDTLPRWFLIMSIISFTLINAHFLYSSHVNPISPIVMIGLFLLWISFVLFFVFKKSDTKSTLV